MHAGWIRSPGAVTAPTSVSADDKPYLRHMLGIPVGQAISLQAVTTPEPGQKPPQPIYTLVAAAILGSPARQLRAKDIYAAFSERFEWYRQNDQRAWQVCIL